MPHSRLSYPQNLISDIIGKYCDMELSEEQLDKLETVVSELPFGEQNAIRYRYKYHFTPRQAGKKIGMSESRVLGHQKKAMVKSRRWEAHRTIWEICQPKSRRTVRVKNAMSNVM